MDWLDFANNTIQAAARTAQVAESGYYPPGTNVYAPTNVGYPPGYAPYGGGTPYQTNPYATSGQGQPGFSLTGNSGLWLIGIAALVLIFSGRKH